MAGSAASDALSSFVRPVLGLPAWGAKRGYGSFLTFEFGEPRLGGAAVAPARKDDPKSAVIHGESHLWIYNCDWRISLEGSALAESEDPAEHIDSAVSIFNGRKLIDVKAAPSAGRSTFVFDLGGLLETWPYEDGQSDEQWMFFSRSEVFTFRGDGLYQREPSNFVSSQEQWLPL